MEVYSVEPRFYVICGFDVDKFLRNGKLPGTKIEI